MKTFDEAGNIISDTEDVPFPASLHKHMQMLQGLHSLHSQVIATPVNKKTVLTACALAAALGAAWWMNQQHRDVNAVDYDEDEYEDQE